MLKPCPFCGCEAENYGCFVHCTFCHAEGTPGEDHSESADLWNRRPKEDRLESRIADLEKRLEEIQETNKNNVANWELQYKEARNSALEEAAQLFDDFVKSSNWNPADLEFFAVKIRALKVG